MDTPSYLAGFPVPDGFTAALRQQADVVAAARGDGNTHRAAALRDVADWLDGADAPLWNPTVSAWVLAEAAERCTNAGQHACAAAAARLAVNLGAGELTPPSWLRPSRGDTHIPRGDRVRRPVVRTGTEAAR